MPRLGLWPPQRRKLQLQRRRKRRKASRKRKRPMASRVSQLRSRQMALQPKGAIAPPGGQRPTESERNAEKRNTRGNFDGYTERNRGTNEAARILFTKLRISLELLITKRFKCALYVNCGRVRINVHHLYA